MSLYKIVNYNDRLKFTLSYIEEIEGQILYVIDKDKKVIGSLTDGDIRRFLIKNDSLESRAEDACNKDFSFARDTDSREKMIKLLDQEHIKSIPVLNSSNQLIKVIDSKEMDFSSADQPDVFARAPARVGFAGGGTDLTSFFHDSKGAVLNCAVKKYARAHIKLRNDNKYLFKSFDTQEEVIYNSREEVVLDGKLDLLKCAVLVFDEIPPMDLSTQSEIPIGSGLGGSSSLVVAIIAAMAKLLGKNYSPYLLSEKAFFAERLIFSSAGGWQDQYASAFGGLNFMEFSLNSNTILPIRLDSSTLIQFQEWCYLIDSNISHNSSKIHKQIKKEKNYKEKYSEVFDLSYTLRDLLMRGDIEGFANSLNKVWEIKKDINENISSKDIDKMYKDLIQAGASGGKLLGAGGGGYFLMLVNPLNRSSFLSSEKLKKYNIESLVFDNQGAFSW